MLPSETRPARILVADDQSDIREALRLLLKGEGFQVETVATPQEVLTALASSACALVLIDLNYARDTTSGQEGLDLLRQIQERCPALPVVVLTGWGSVDVAVESVRRGACDFVTKPWDNARLLATVRSQLCTGSEPRETPNR